MRVTTLTEFLLARIAERVQVAQAAAWNEEKYRAWQLAGRHGSLEVQTVATEGTSPEYAEHIAITCDREGLSDSVATREAGAHIALNDPAYVLADCEAKRRIVEIHQVAPTYVSKIAYVVRDGRREAAIMGGGCYTCHDGEGGWCDTLCLLALPFADHPDYREEWKP